MFDTTFFPLTRVFLGEIKKFISKNFISRVIHTQAIFHELASDVTRDTREPVRLELLQDARKVLPQRRDHGDRRVREKQAPHLSVHRAGNFDPVRKLRVPNLRAQPLLLAP